MPLLATPRGTVACGGDSPDSLADRRAHSRLVTARQATPAQGGDVRVIGGHDVTHAA
ncbi:hypothetical protein [Streptomyces sp. NPDC001717]|uniref:hypothetical protein n=1 Tax=Streptomyces sp. NPDC001717 TaxID=3364604 RepID=UPI0036A2FF5F